MASVQDKQKMPQESLVGQTLCNDEYYVQRVIGYGGMGKVYLASHSELKVPVALKQARADQPLPESVTSELDSILQSGDGTRRASQSQDFPSSGGVHTDRFLREALFLARLQHPALPSLYDYFFEDGNWYLVMDYIPGPTLTHYMRQQGPLPPLEALNYAMQLCDVFDYLHKQSPPIIFRDLKPSNVLVTPKGALMLVDFGIARYFKEGQSNDTTDFGSPGYASPEQYQAEGQTDGRSDLFSLGVLLHEMISGERPNAPGSITSPQRDTHSRPNHSNLTAVLSGLIALATRTEPMYRFQSAHTFYLALERAYTIEEQRTYHQRVMLEQAMEPTNEGREDVPTIAIVDQNEQLEKQSEGQESLQKLASSPRINSLHPAQRRQIRETLQQMRRERLEEEELETQLLSVDDGLQQRMSMPLSRFPVPDAEEPEESRSSMPVYFNARRFIRSSFIVVLVIFLVLASLLVFARVTRHKPLITQGTHVHATHSSGTATVNGTSTGRGSSWQILPSLPSPQADNTAAYVLVQGRAYIYVNGGYRGAKASPHYDRHLYRYDIAAAHWETSGDAQFPGMVNNAVAVDLAGRIFYTVGYSTDTYSVTSLLYMYQPASNSLRKIIPPAQVNIGFGGSILADTQGHLYITQGFTQSGNAQQAGTGWYRYDIATSQWHTLSPLPLGLGYTILAPGDNNGILLIGGATDTGQHHQTNMIYRYDTAHDTWTQVPTTTPIPLSGATSSMLQPGQLIVIGGYDVAHDKGLDSAWLVDLYTLKWTPLAHLPTGGSVLGAAACDGKAHVFLVRGASDPSKPTPDFWELTV